MRMALPDDMADIVYTNKNVWIETDYNTRSIPVKLAMMFVAGSHSLTPAFIIDYFPHEGFTEEQAQGVIDECRAWLDANPGYFMTEEPDDFDETDG